MLVNVNFHRITFFKNPFSCTKYRLMFWSWNHSLRIRIKSFYHPTSKDYSILFSMIYRKLWLVTVRYSILFSMIYHKLWLVTVRYSILFSMIYRKLWLVTVRYSILFSMIYHKLWLVTVLTKISWCSSPESLITIVITNLLVVWIKVRCSDKNWILLLADFRCLFVFRRFKKFKLVPWSFYL